MDLIVDIYEIEKSRKCQKRESGVKLNPWRRQAVTNVEMKYAMDACSDQQEAESVKPSEKTVDRLA